MFSLQELVGRGEQILHPTEHTSSLITSVGQCAEPNDRLWMEMAFYSLVLRGVTIIIF